MEAGEPLRRFAVIGDIHCEDRALDAVLGFLSGAAMDAVLAVGDIVDGHGDADRCCRLLEEGGVLAVAGNHDRWLLAGEMRSLPEATREVSAASRAFLESLPPTRELRTIDGKLMLCHGVGDDDMAVLRPDTRGYGLQAVFSQVRGREDLSLVVGGHAHRRMARRVGALTFLNPGTLLRDHEPGFLLVDLGRGELCFHDVSQEGRVAPSQPIERPWAFGS